MSQSTIAAISTSLSPSGIGIIRISGNDAFNIIKKIFFNKSHNPIFDNEIESHTVSYGFIFDGDNIIDEVLTIVMKGPHTYTGEDTVEIDCHGGVLVMRTILETVIKNGARIAEPGEFSKRAFLNGKMDLSKAESVMDLIDSSNRFAMDNSLKHLTGKMKSSIEAIRSKIIYEVAFIESCLDDPEHYSFDESLGEFELKVNDVINDLNILLKNAKNGRILKEGINTAIVGKPNVGKSSLLNAMVGDERAIVTDIAGTTRDVLSETITFDGITLNIMDTAGIHDTDDVVEKIGVNRSINSIDNADLVLFIIDSTRDITKEDYDIYNLVRDKNLLILSNKNDLESSRDISSSDIINGHKVFSISAKGDKGIDDVMNEIKNMFFEGDISFNNEVYITNERQKECISNAINSMMQVKASIEACLPEDFFSIDLMNAYEELGKITGLSVGEDLVNEIFSKFCMGK